MTTVRFRHDIGDLADDLRTIAIKAKPEMVKIIRKGTKVGQTVARDFAKESSGPHGKNYYKRITSEVISPLVGEWGPTGEVEGNAIGAGWRHGQNTDLPRSADVMGPALARESRDLLANLFWPGA